MKMMLSLNFAFVPHNEWKSVGTIEILSRYFYGMKNSLRNGTIQFL